MIHHMMIGICCVAIRRTDDEDMERSTATRENEGHIKATIKQMQLEMRLY